MDSDCVYDCVHPWWGGSGICAVSDAGDPVCVCDAGYASRDARGNASCVPRRVLVAAYLLLLAAVSVVGAALIVWNINQYRYLSVRIQSSRKTSIRMRALVSTGLFAIGYTSVAFALAVGAGKRGYNDTGVLQINYIIFVPSMVFGITMMAEYWVECLPSQVVTPGSFAGVLKNASETSNAFVLVGLANGSPILVLGVLTLLFEDWPQRVADAVVGAVTLGTMGVILFVAIQTTSVINQALAKGSASSKAFYVKARNKLWRQAANLCGVACGVIAVTLIKQLTAIGQQTPSIVTTIQVLCAHAAGAAFASATRFEAPRLAAQSVIGSGAETTHVVGSPTSAITDLAVAMQERLLAQRRLFSAHRAIHTDEKDEPTLSGMAETNLDIKNDLNPMGVVVKSELSGRKEPNRHSLDGAAAKVLPIHEDYTQDGNSNLCLPPEEWTVDSVDDVEQQEVPWLCHSLEINTRSDFPLCAGSNETLNPARAVSQAECASPQLFLEKTRKGPSNLCRSTFCKGACRRDAVWSMQQQG